MGVRSGYNHYQCDRCGKEAYLDPKGAEASAWSKLQRISVDKATSEDPITAYEFCNDCRNAYTSFDRPQDDAFADFMAQPARDRAAAQAQADADAKAKAEQEKAARQKEIDDAVAAAVAKAKAEQKAEDEKTMIKVPDTPTVTPGTGAGYESGDTTDTGGTATDKNGSDSTGIVENPSGSDKEND